jgi:predicted RNA binding protein YcfA (HicA-like mRNA interferase family)
VKRAAFERHLRRNGAVFERHGRKHDVWRGPDGRQSSVPRHREIKEGTVRAICEQLGVPEPR